MSYSENDFITNSFIMLQIIENIFKNVILNIIPANLNLDECDTSYNMANIQDLERLQLFIQKYFHIASCPLIFNRTSTPHAPDSDEEMPSYSTITEVSRIHSDTPTIDIVDFSAANYSFFIKKVKENPRHYNERLSEIDHFSESQFFKQLCLFRFFYKYFFKQTLMPLGTDKLYFALKQEFCEFHADDCEGIAEAILTVSQNYGAKQIKPDKLLLNLRSTALEVDKLRTERELMCENQVRALQYIHERKSELREAKKSFSIQKAAAFHFLNAIANVYARGFLVAAQNPRWGRYLNDVKEENRRINKHESLMFYSVFPPKYFSYPEFKNNYKSLKDTFKNNKFLNIITYILYNCYKQRISLEGGPFNGHLWHWWYGYQYVEMAKLILDILNSDSGRYVLMLKSNLPYEFKWSNFHKFHTSEMYKFNPKFTAFNFDYNDNFRCAYSVIQICQVNLSKAETTYQDILKLDSDIAIAEEKFNAIIFAVCEKISYAHRKQHREVARRLSLKKSSSQATNTDIDQKDIETESIGDEFYESASEASLPDTVSSFNILRSASEESLNNPKFSVKRASGADVRSFQKIRAFSSQKREHGTTEQKSFQIVDFLTGDENSDFKLCLDFIMQHSSDYIDLITIRNQLYKTYLAREIHMSMHVTWTGTRQRKCTEYWSHIERIIQILSLTNMMSRGMKLSNISRICDHHFFLIQNRCALIILKKNQKRICGMAKRFFTHLRAKEYCLALEDLRIKWVRYVQLYELPEMDTESIIANNPEYFQS
ncbi:hypothetical protein AAEX28_05155 [Lentisphaerota bacterium WC36G]|nr:hypothetical protein LJT99_08010 [Lentisphaerae bacterium WC36]